MATLRQDLGPVTAYAYAVSEGYTGTEEEFAEVLANFADSAEQVAADAAQVALDKGAVHDDKEAVDSAEGRVTSAVNTFTTTTAPNAVTAVENAGTAQIGLVEAEGTRQIGLVADKGTEQVGTVSSEGTTQIGLVEAKGAEVIASIPGDYSTLQGDIASTYSSSNTYAVGDYVLYSGQLYRCTTAISTPEAWTSAKWTAVALGDDVGDLKSALEELDSEVFTVRPNPEITWNADLVVKGDGYIRANNPTKVSNPIALKKGETIKVTTKGDGISWFGCIASVPSINTPIYEYSVIATVLQVIASNSLTEYTYTANATTYIICCVYDDNTSKVEFDNLEKQSNIEELAIDIEAIASAHPITYRYTPVELDFTSYPYKKFGVSNGKIVITDETSSNNFCICKLDVSEGEQYKICGLKYYQARCFAVVDESDNVLASDSGSGNVYNVVQTVTIPTNGVYMYVSGYFLQNVQRYAISSDISILSNKKIAYNGDSICATVLNNNTNRMNGGGFAKVISDITGCEFWNTAVDGSILRQKEGSGTNYHSVSDSIVDMPTDADIYCFEGGINDYWTNAVLGTYSATDYTTELDKTTVCGALEYIFRYCINNFIGKAICFVIVHKVGNTSFSANSQGDTFKDYHDAFVGLCEKYGIPYYDAWYQSGLNGWNSTQSSAYLTANPEGTGDGTHPNKAGYEKYYAPQLIKLFESIVKR